MKEEYQNTLNIIKEQKKLIIEEINKEKDFIVKQNLINNLMNLDENINKILKKKN